MPQACVDGVVKAFAIHQCLTGGLPLTFAPEAFIQGQIALELHARGKLVTMETGVMDTLYEAEASMRGRPVKRLKGRVDLVTWWKTNGKPHQIIEVKKLRYSGDADADVKRIRGILKKAELDAGYVVLYCDAKKGKTVTNRIQQAVQQTGCNIEAKSDVTTFLGVWLDEKDWHYQVACLKVLP